MTEKFIKKASRKKLEKTGFNFTWGYSAFECCVRYNQKWIGTWRTKRAYEIPRQEIIDSLC